MSKMIIRIDRREFREDCIIGTMSVQYPFPGKKSIANLGFTLELPWKGE